METFICTQLFLNICDICHFKVEVEAVLEAAVVVGLVVVALLLLVQTTGRGSEKPCFVQIYFMSNFYMMFSHPI